MESQAQLSQQPRSQTLSLQNFNIPKRHGTLAPAYVSSEQHLHGVEGAPVARTYRWRPTALETQEKKIDGDRITLITGNSSRVPSSRVVDSRQNLDANQSNQSYTHRRTRIPRITCACTSDISGI